MRRCVQNLSLYRVGSPSPLHIEHDFGRLALGLAVLLHVSWLRSAGGRKEAKVEFYCLFACLLDYVKYQNALGGMRCSVEITEGCSDVEPGLTHLKVQVIVNEN